MIKVLVAETNAVLRGGIQSALDTAADIHIVAEVISVEQLLSCLTVLPYDILLIEADFLHRASTQTHDTYLYEQPLPKTIVFSYTNNPAQGLVALKNGVCGYLTKRCSPAELREAITRVAAGERYIDHAFVEELTSFLMVAPNALPQLLLSLRELRIYKMLMLGLGLPGIAAQLGISVHAARFNRERIIEKLQLDGIAALVRQTATDACPAWRPA